MTDGDILAKVEAICQRSPPPSRLWSHTIAIPDNGVIIRPDRGGMVCDDQCDRPNS
ncbi:MAG: hypothetical protein ACFB12_06360 [Leptolyngbyaceae cyanobacterium]